MSSTKSQIRALGAVAVLATLAFAISCRGFFVQPILSSLTVAPNTPSIETGSTNNTVQMSAIGQFNDGSTGSAAVSWSISDPSTATISANGLVTSVAVGSATVTAMATQNPSITGTQQVTVTVGCITSITLNPTSGTISVGGATHTISISATANTCTPPPVPITDVANWNTSNSQVATVAGGVVTAVTPGQVNITASSGGVTSGNALITVTP